MSHHSDDAMLVVTSDSFWEPGNYKRTTKRTEDGFKLCNDLVQLIQERSEIEKNYAKSLKCWAKKWNELIERGPEYGTTEAAWKAALVEADRKCEMHMNFREKLVDDMVNRIKHWQKDSYHRSMIHLKEKKEFEDSFKKVNAVSFDLQFFLFLVLTSNGSNHFLSSFLLPTDHYIHRSRLKNHGQKY